jgi:hypothetical protein
MPAKHVQVTPELVQHDGKGLVAVPRLKALTHPPVKGFQPTGFKPWNAVMVLSGKHPVDPFAGSQRCVSFHDKW